MLELNLPPLRRRGDDIALLLNHYIHFEHERTGCHLHTLSEQAMHELMRYSWPGNIREMKNFCERICILCQKECAQPEDVCRALPELSNRSTVGKISASAIAHDLREQSESPPAPYDEPAEIRKALSLFRNNRTRAAEYLRIHPSTLWRKMKKYGIL